MCIRDRYHVFGTRTVRCMSLATSAAPLSVRRPATAKLLLPMAVSGSTPKSQRLSLVQLPIIADSNVGGWELGAGSFEGSGLGAGSSMEGLPDRRARRL